MRYRVVHSTVLVWLALNGGLLRAAPSASGSSRHEGGAGTSHAAASAAPAEWITRQTTFSIPFTVQQASAPPAAIELYVSRDRGSTWQLSARERPTMGHFQFRADDSGGEYWFASRTVETNRTPKGISELQPELRVIIDLAEPQLNFEAKVGPSGEVESSWRASDSTLDPATFKIEYQLQAGHSWKPVAIDRKESRLVDQTLVGRMTWRPDAGATALHVRAEISDRAGNKSVVNRVVLLPQNVASTTPDRPWAAAGVPSDPFRRARELAENGVTWPADNRLPPSPLPLSDPTQGRRHFVHRARPVIPETQVPKEADLSPLNKHAAAIPPIQENVRPPVSQQFPQSKTTPVSVTRGRPTPDMLPAGERPRMTNTRQFQLDYAIDSVGPSGVQKVELWGTKDGGQTWSVWQLDEDLQSPLDVEVESEGLYGFRVVVVANNGLAGPAPRNGDLADLWVGVDETQPVVRLTSAIYGDQDRVGQLDVRWEASDDRFIDRPITLLFSDQLQGPWTTIASGLPNDGQYFWSVEPRIPNQIYLRIEARDEAGNIGIHQLTEPISISGLTPQAHIQGIRPRPGRP